MATEELDDRPAFPSARYERALRGVVAELARHQHKKARRDRIEIEDRALYERTKDILKPLK